MLLQYLKREKEKNDFILTKKKIISPTHIKDKQVVDVDFGKDNGAQTYSHIKKTTLVISNMKGMSVSKDSLKKKKIHYSYFRGKENECTILFFTIGK
jgi:hypothetical protein